MSCNICFDTFTKVLRKRVDCTACDKPICRPCLQQFLLQDTSAEPVCPSCRIGWSREFLDEHLTATYRNGAFKQFRQKVLTDRERARFPEIQERAANYKKAIDFLKPIYAEITKLKAELKAYDRTEYDIAMREWITYCSRNGVFGPNGEKNHTEESKRLEAIYKEHNKKFNDFAGPRYERLKELNKLAYKPRRIEIRFGVVPPPPRPFRRIPRAAVGGAGAPEQDVEPADEPKPKEFVYMFKCPADACEGFINANSACGLCDLKVCKECLEPTTEGHTCNPNTVESVKAIKKQAKPCPKCKTQIIKNGGCDHMYCTQCQTHFSWRTGTIDTVRQGGNPHYYEYMNQLQARAGDLPNNARANPCGADAILYNLMQLRRGANMDTVNRLIRYHRLFAHIQGVDIINCQTVVQNYINDNNEDSWRIHLRVRRMANEITEGEWKSILHSKEKEMMKERARGQVLEMYVTAGMDILGQVITNDNVQDILKQIATLYEFAEKASQKVSNVYKCPPMNLEPPEMNQEIQVIRRAFLTRHVRNQRNLQFILAHQQQLQQQQQAAPQPAPIAT